MKSLGRVVQAHVEHHLNAYERTVLRDDTIMFPVSPVEVIHVGARPVPFLFLGSGTQVGDLTNHIVGHTVVPLAKPVMSRQVVLPGGHERRIRVYAPAESLAVRFWAFDLLNGVAVAEAYGVVKDAMWVPTTAEPYDEAVRLFNEGEQANLRAMAMALVETANVLQDGRALDGFLGEAAAIGERAFAESDRADVRRQMQWVRRHARGEEVLLSHLGRAIVVRRGRRRSGSTPPRDSEPDPLGSVAGVGCDLEHGKKISR